MRRAHCYSDGPVDSTLCLCFSGEEMTHLLQSKYRGFIAQVFCCGEYCLLMQKEHWLLSRGCRGSLQITPKESRYVSFLGEFIRALYINAPAQLWENMRVLRYGRNSAEIEAANSSEYTTHIICMCILNTCTSTHAHNLRESSIGWKSDCLGQML